MQRQQMFMNSCGAVCLLCAAGELAIFHLPNLPGSMCLGQRIQPTGNCEAAIYQLTSGATTGSRPVGAALHNAGYSMPHNIVFAARLMGLDGEIFMQNNWTSLLLRQFYPSAVNLSTGFGITINQQAAPAPGPNERVLRIVRPMVIGLHYVLERPDGTFMDPGTGQNYPNFAAMGYPDTGIAILIRPRRVAPGTLRPLDVAGVGRLRPRINRQRRDGIREAPF